MPSSDTPTCWSSAIHGRSTKRRGSRSARIKRNQRVLLALINDVLNFAKLEAGKLEFVI